MTTNALILSRIAADLKDAGLDRINVSIDTLDPVKFQDDDPGRRGSTSSGRASRRPMRSG